MRLARYLPLVGLSAGSLLWLALAGCRPAPSSPAAAPSRPASAATVQGSPRYREAARRYGRKDYAGALARVDQLLAASDLSPADRAFLRRQRAICQSALTPVSSPKFKGGRTEGVAAPAAPTPPQRPPASADCGPRALLLVCRKIGVPADLEALRRASGTTREGTSLAGLAQAAKKVGLKAAGVQMDRDALARLSPPAIAWVDGNHYVAVLQVNGDRASIHDPNKPGKEEVPLADLLGRSGGVLLTLMR